MRKITNIVIYKSIVDGKELVKSCVFYNDGTAEEGSYADGIAAIKTVAKEKGITNKDQLREIMNKDMVYTMTEAEFKKRCDSFLTKVEEVEEEPEIEKEEVETTPVVAVVKVPEVKEEVSTEAPKKAEIEDTDDEEVVIEENFEVAEEDEQEENDNYYYENPEVEKEEKVVYEEKTTTKTKKKNGLLSKIAIGILGFAVGVAGCCALKRCSKTGTMTNNTITTTTTTTTDNTNESEYTVTDGSTYTVRNNDLYNDYTFAELLDVTTNEFQKNSMVKVSSGLTGFNSIFAKNYLESGHDIRAALTFDEVVALQQAYNNYSTDEVRAYFNGYEVNAIYMSNAYKSASLQLMGAYTIETSEHPVDMSVLIDSQEGRDFYNRYHAMFLAAKEAKGDEQLRLVKEFYAAVEKDFPITEEVRTEGISHSEDHNSLKDYQLAVAPMIASAEMIFQNLDVDYTLDDTKVDFLNDIGLCNHADDKFERLETITLSAYEDKENPKYEQYKNAIVAELVKSNEYVIDDAHRELSELRRFQEVVNNDPLWKHRTTYEGEYGETYTDYEESVEVIEWEESSTDYETVVTTEEAEIPDDEKDKIDKEIDKENEEARKKAEEEAEEERKRQQEEEDKKADEIQKEVEEEEEQLGKDIDDINDKIDDNNKDTDLSNNKPVNENDYDNIDFDDEYTDDKGNLDGSVEKVTIDDTGANEELPDPNETGKKFDSQASTTTTDTTTTEYSEEDMSNVYVEYTGVDGAYIEYDGDYIPYDADGNPIITEESGNQKTR